jgi:hypothetical protein
MFYSNDPGGSNLTAISMKSDLFRVTTLALAFVAFASTASAQQLQNPLTGQGFAMYYNKTNCQGIAIQLDATGLTNSSFNACRGTCESIQGIIIGSAIVVDKQGATTCYIWNAANCKGTFITVRNDCINTNFTVDVMSVQCFRGSCNS